MIKKNIGINLNAKTNSSLLACPVFDPKSDVVGFDTAEPKSAEDVAVFPKREPKVRSYWACQRSSQWNC